jgi:hypothetical protein
MLSFTATAVSIHGLSFLRNLVFATLNCASFGALIYFSHKGRKASWFLWAILGCAIIFVISLSHLKHQLLELSPSSQSLGLTGATLERTIQETGNALLIACLWVSGVYIVLRGWSLLVLFSTMQVPDATLVIFRFFFGALLCVGILGAGLSAHRAPVARRQMQETGMLKKQ